MTERTAESRVGRPGLAGSLVYLVAAMPLGLVGGLAPLLLTVTGASLTVVWVGVPVLMVTTLCWRWVADAERWWVRVTLGVHIPRPYRPRPEGSLFRRWRAKLGDPATWRDITYIVLRLPLCVVEPVVVLVLWACSLAAVSLPTWAARVGPRLPDQNFHLVRVHTVSQALPYAGIGLVLLVITVLLTTRVTHVQALLAKALLGPTAAATLAVKAERLQASRARGVDAAEAERRRIERDLHDGAQQRLVAVAMTLGRAKTKLGNDPESLRALIDEAHADAKQAVAELRDLARGIYPAVLGDRGLDAALSALAARCPVPVDIEVDVQPRPPTAVESTAYFIVAEALTNVTKYASATWAKAAVTRDGDSVVVQVSDNGMGGAELKPGGGLAGLADRAATIDGVITVHSPIGGPTIVTAELPCVW